MLHVNYIKRGNKLVRIVDMKPYRLKKKESFVSEDEYYYQFNGKLYDGMCRRKYDKLNDRVKYLLYTEDIEPNFNSMV